MLAGKSPVPSVSDRFDSPCKKVDNLVNSDWVLDNSWTSKFNVKVQPGEGKFKINTVFVPNELGENWEFSGECKFDGEYVGKLWDKDFKFTYNADKYTSHVDFGNFQLSDGWVNSYFKHTAKRNKVALDFTNDKFVQGVTATQNYETANMKTSNKFEVEMSGKDLMFTTWMKSSFTAASLNWK